MSDEVRSGTERIAAERARQITEEEYTFEHDATHVGGELAWAAVCYAAPSPVLLLARQDRAGMTLRDPWPWGINDGHDKRLKHDRIRALEKAGALIAAEIDRLLYAEMPAENGAGRCHAGTDGDCLWEEGCPQLRDGEPKATGRSCPLYDWGEREP